MLHGLRSDRPANAGAQSTRLHILLRKLQKPMHSSEQQNSCQWLLADAAYVNCESAQSHETIRLAGVCPGSVWMGESASWAG